LAAETRALRCPSHVTGAAEGHGTRLEACRLYNTVHKPFLTNPVHAGALLLLAAR